MTLLRIPITLGNDMTSRRLPSFAALRAFEAVARTRSFTRAAGELGVTQAAISRQVRALEQVLGVDLLERQAAGNVLTEPGRSLYSPLRDSLDRIEEAVRSVSSWPHRAVLTVSVAPFFSAAWLTPRIMTFITKHPAVDLRLHHSYEPPDHHRDRIDLGVNWGDGRWRRVSAEKILDGALTPVCSPAMAARFEELSTPAALLDAALFYEFSASDWMAWFALFDLHPADRLAATRIDDSHALRRAALEGHGLALICRTLVEEDLAVGRLVQPFDRTVDTGFHYFLNYPSDRELSSAAKAFRRWLLDERGT